MSKSEQQYLDLLKYTLDNGVEKPDRTNTGTISVFGRQTRYNLQEGFPLLTTKRVPFKLVVSELLWFLRGDTNIKYLLENNNHIWTDNAFDLYVCYDPAYEDWGNRRLKYEEYGKFIQKRIKNFECAILSNESFAEEFGDLGNIYGKQWRRWEDSEGNEIDQIANVIKSIKETPESRRHIVSGWNVGELDSMALPPCHTLFQFYVADNKLSCHLYQRSQDEFLGMPFNIASYALLTHIIAREVGLDVGELVITAGDSHIYLNHIDQVKEQLTREPRDLPQLRIHSDKPFDELEVDDFELVGYNPHPSIKAPMAV